MSKQFLDLGVNKQLQKSLVDLEICTPYRNTRTNHTSYS